MSTLVAQTLSNGSVSTSTANCIRGSAKAWVNFQGGQPSGTAGTINGSYNVSSITVVGTGAYTINFTTAFANTNYCGLGTAYYDDGASMNVVTWRTISASSMQMKVCYQNGGLTNTTGVNAAFFS